MSPPSDVPARSGQLLRLAAKTLTFSIVAAATFLLIVLLFLGVAKPGPYSLAILGGAGLLMVGWIGFRFFVPQLRRVRPQFSLRSLVVALAMLGVALAWIAWRLDQARLEKRIIQEFVNSGGSISFDRPAESVGDAKREGRG